MSSLKVFLSVLALGFGLSACGNTDEWWVTHTGNMPTNERISQVHEGMNKNEVRSILGVPSTVVSLDQNTWIYMSSDIKRVAFFAPEEVNRDVLTIKFDGNDVVTKISRNGVDAGSEVDVAEEATETLGHERGFFERFFGGTQTYAPMGGGSGRM